MQIFILQFLLIFVNADLSTKAPWPEAKLLGQAPYSYLIFDVYEAKLWGTTTDNLYADKMALELIYQRDFSGKQIAKQTEKEMKHIGVDKAKLDKWSQSFADLFVDVKKGDSILAKYDPETGVKLYLNRTKQIGTIEDLEFAQSFLDIWLSEKTSATKFRQQLLGV